MADAIVPQVEITFDPTCPTCSRPDMKRVVRYDSYYTNLIVCTFLCARGHMWQVKYAENQEDCL